jgi:hypothetical protein
MASLDTLAPHEFLLQKPGPIRVQNGNKRLLGAPEYASSPVPRLLAVDFSRCFLYVAEMMVGVRRFEIQPFGDLLELPGSAELDALSVTLV